jgi:hypothetical protein
MQVYLIALLPILGHLTPCLAGLGPSLWFYPSTYSVLVLAFSGLIYQTSSA